MKSETSMCVITPPNDTSNVADTWNVIGEKEFKSRVRSVFGFVADALTHTLGPYGSTTIIEKYGEMAVTKDGWQVLKNIHSSDPINNNILMLLLRISSQVILKVGDGSTSSIVAANSILQKMEDELFLANIRPKDLMLTLDTCVTNITEAIYNNSYKIDKTTYNEIYKLAYIATNADHKISTIIQEIYKATNNPAIEYVLSKTDKTYYEIVEGYKLNHMTYIDSIFTTADDGTCTIDNPYFLLFDHKLDIDTSLPIISAAVTKALDDKRRLVVCAPNYDKFLLEYIKKNIMIEYKSTGSSSIVYTRVALISNTNHDLYNDFAVMTGGEIIRQQHLDTIDVETINIDEYLGESTQAIIGKNDTVIKGFTKRNDSMYQKIVENANYKYAALEEDYRDRGIVDMKLNELKNRVAKLKGSMGIIYVGGYSTLEKKANFDLVEDAVKACESADTYGYNCGGSLIIPFTIRQLLKDIDKDDTTLVYMYNTLHDAFVNVFKTVIGNKYGQEEKNMIDIGPIIEKCLGGTEVTCYDLISDEYSDSVINSCMTDIEILKATASIISLLVSSNQYISITNLDDSTIN